jgi:hypothetical protein
MDVVRNSIVKEKKCGERGTRSRRGVLQLVEL